MKYLTLLATFVLMAPLSLTFASDQDEDDIQAVRSCLRNFGTHPFKSERPTFRTIGAKVRVLGIGGSTTDETVTETPELVLVKPNVAVLSKGELNLLNPNAWYCLHGQTAVLGKTEVKLHCDAKLGSTRDGVTVFGNTDYDKGVTVLGVSRITRVGCPKEKSGVSSTEFSPRPSERL